MLQLEESKGILAALLLGSSCLVGGLIAIVNHHFSYKKEVKNSIAMVEKSNKECLQSYAKKYRKSKEHNRHIEDVLLSLAKENFEVKESGKHRSVGLISAKMS